MAALVAAGMIGALTLAVVLQQRCINRHSEEIKKLQAREGAETLLRPSAELRPRGAAPPERRHLGLLRGGGSIATIGAACAALALLPAPDVQASELAPAAERNSGSAHGA